jgi:hypothetical protein
VRNHWGFLFCEQVEQFYNLSQLLIKFDDIFEMDKRPIYAKTGLDEQTESSLHKINKYSP